MTPSPWFVPLHANYINKYTSLKYQYKKNRLSLIGWLIDRAVDTCRRWLRSGWVLTQCSTWRRRPPTCHTAHRPAPTPRCLPVQQSHRWWRPVTIYAKRFTWKQQKAQLMPTNPRDAMLCRRAKFGDDRTMRGRVIAYFRFSEWRPSAILDLVWRHSGPPTTCFWWS